MHNLRKPTVMCCALWGLLACLFAMGPSPAAAEEKPASPVPAGKPGLMQRIDFGNSYIMGQSIKSGAVYLLHRKQSDIESMISIRTNYRKEIMEEYRMPAAELAENKADGGGKRVVAPSGFKASMLADPSGGKTK